MINGHAIKNLCYSVCFLLFVITNQATSSLWQPGLFL